VNAGRELDAVIAEKVMGYKYSDQFKAYVHNERAIDYSYAPPFSTDIAWAWEVLNKLNFSVIKTPDGFISGEAEYQFGQSQTSGYEEWPEDYNIGYAIPAENNPVECETAPHAICLAALKVIGAIKDASV